MSARSAVVRAQGRAARIVHHPYRAIGAFSDLAKIILPNAFEPKFDQAILRSAISDAAANLLDFVPSLGTGEAFVFGEGVALPTRLRFAELPPHIRPYNEAVINLRPRFLKVACIAGPTFRAVDENAVHLPCADVHQ